jgi:ribose transport system permease protein
LIWRRYRAALLALIGLPLIVLVYWTQQPLILSSFGAKMLANQGTTLALAAMAQMVVVLTRGVDLSVGAIVGLSNAIAASYMGDTVMSAGLTIVAVLAIGTLAGMLNGVIVAYAWHCWSCRNPAARCRTGSRPALPIPRGRCRTR